MHLTIIGKPKADTLYIGLVKKPEDALADMGDSGVVVLGEHKLAAGWDTLAMLLVERELSSFRRANGWFAVPLSQAQIAVTHACLATQIDKPKPHRFGAALKYIRAQIFGTSQQVIAAITGRDAATVSRWEADAIEPTLVDIKHLRDFAYAHGLPWNDNVIWQTEDTHAGTSHLEAEVGVAS